MALFYKRFHTLRIDPRPGFLFKAFLALGFIGALIVNTPANAEPTLYTVSNINVDVSDENALKAREKAFEEAQIKAFEELAGRVLPEARFTSFTAPPTDTISRMIQDYEISDEKLAAKRYIGTYVFRFRRSLVDQYFSLNAPQASAQASQEAPQTSWNSGEPALQYERAPPIPGSYEGAPYRAASTPVAPNNVPRAAGRSYTMHVQFNSLQQWTRLQTDLAKVYGVQDIALKALSPREAYLDINFVGDLRQLQTALGQSGLRLNEVSGRSYYQLVSIGAHAPNAPPASAQNTAPSAPSYSNQF